MPRVKSKEKPPCKVCGRKLWYDHTLEDTNEQWVCPVRWFGPNLLKREPKDPEWEKHSTIIVPPQQKDIIGVPNPLGHISVEDYIKKYEK